MREIHISCVTRNTTRHAPSTFRAFSVSLSLSLPLPPPSLSLSPRFSSFSLSTKMQDAATNAFSLTVRAGGWHEVTNLWSTKIEIEVGALPSLPPPGLFPLSDLFIIGDFDLSLFLRGIRFSSIDIRKTRSFLRITRVSGTVASRQI